MRATRRSPSRPSIRHRVRMQSNPRLVSARRPVLRMPRRWHRALQLGPLDHFRKHHRHRQCAVQGREPP